MLLEKNSQYRDKCDYCGCKHKRCKQNCPALGKICDKCGGKKHFKVVCRSKDNGSKSRKRSDRTNGKCKHRCNVHEINEDCHNDNGIEDLTDQVQSLFYH